MSSSMRLKRTQSGEFSLPPNDHRVEGERRCLRQELQHYRRREAAAMGREGLASSVHRDRPRRSPGRIPRLNRA